MQSLLEHNDKVKCPCCHAFIEVWVEDKNLEEIWGEGYCHQCRLDIEFESSILSNKVTVRSSCRRYYRRYQIGKCMQTKQLYVVTSGHGEDYHVVAIFTSIMSAQHLCDQDRSYQVEIFPCVDIPERKFLVYVVSVGEGSRYRILEVTPDKRFAAKIASSIRGKIKTYEVYPGPATTERVRYHKYFIPLENSEDPYYEVDRFSRRMDYGAENKPILTRRRRYNSSLPYRLEIAHPERSICSEICEQICVEIDKDEFDVSILEYNVDYELIKTNNKWEIEPCLLGAPHTP